MSDFEASARELAERLSQLHPDEVVPTAYITELLLIVQRMGRVIDNADREERMRRMRPHFPL